MDDTSHFPPTPQSLSPPPCERDTLESETPNAFFERWRPSYHLQPPTGWMNDPCGPGFDPTTGLYHISFQWNPRSNEWGDICWAHATSPDFVSWNLFSEPCLSPDQPYDRLGVFTGCLVRDQESLAYVYTSVNALPIHHTLPYKRGCESLSIALSLDNGQTWKKHQDNPIIPHAPLDVEVTGWRDPFVSDWASMSQLLDRPGDTLYGIISGGIVNKTPTTFVYAINPQNLTKWEYLGPLVDVGLNMRPSRWSGDLGRNWEVTNFVTLHDNHDFHVTRDILIMGTEGCIRNPNRNSSETSGSVERPSRCQLWMAGSLTARQDINSAQKQPTMTYTFGGILDHGCYYAANSFFDPVTQSQIVWGWVPEDDLSDELRREQGWSGMLALPRRVSLTSIPRVVGAWKSDLKSMTSFETTPDGQGTFTVRTLTSLPDSRVVDKFRTQAGVRLLHIHTGPLGSLTTESLWQDLSSNHWELSCRIRVSRNCRRAGFHIAHRKDLSRTTAIYFEPDRETFTVERPAFDHVRSASYINSQPETAAHTLFTTMSGMNGKTETEALEIRVWRDNSVLEIFVNERTAITTRIYAGDDSVGLVFFAEENDCGEVAETGTFLEHAVVWEQWLP